MKRWITVLTALGIFFATTAISVVSVLSVYASNAHAASIYAKNIAVINDFSIYSQFFKERGIQLLTTPSLQLANDSWTATNNGDKDTLKAAATLTAEFTKFTPQQLQKTGLKKIYLVKDLYVEGQYRSGMPEPHFEHALYFDVGNDYLTSENGVYMKRVFQHEPVQLAPRYLAYMDRDISPYRDYIHPNALGQKVIADAVKPEVLSALRTRGVVR